MRMRNFTKLLMLFVLCLVGMQGNAQNVTVRGNNGSTIPAVKNGGSGDTFYRCNGFATWQHEQLSMVLTASDGTVLTPNGQLDNPANNLFVSSDGTKMQIAHGQYPGEYPYTGENAPSNVCYLSLSLPKGFRFTGYAIKFSRPKDVRIGTDQYSNAVYLNPSRQYNDGIANGNFTASTTFGETGSDFAAYKTTASSEEKTYASIAPGGTEQVIKRTESNADPMGNVLYFKLDQPTNVRTMIQWESAEFFFTAEENYSPVTPIGTFSSVSAVDVPFHTSKVDYGRISRQSYQGVSRISYSSANVKDLEANFVLYEAESVTNGTDIDGVTGGKIVDYKTGSISSAGGYFKLGNATKEQVYYIETPTSVTLSDGTKNPVGYRIVGAKFEYTTSAEASGTGFYITGTVNGTKYYLNTAGRFTTTPVPWEIDDDGYISSNGLYLYWNNGYCATQSTKPDSGERFEILNNGRIRQIEYTSYYIRIYQQGNTYYGLITNVNNGSYATAEDLPPIELDNYTLKIYDKEGANPQTINVTGNGTYDLTGLNNDAVKFGVQGIGLVRATLTLQALDPYLDQMQVVCQDEVQTQIRMEQGFTASDFSVSGGEFHFYLPTDCNGHSVAITFEDLKSQYFDESYTGGSASNHSRINFVKSLHYNAFGASNNNVYTNVGEAKNATLERLKVGVVGTAKFKFNNVDEVGQNGGTLTEYPFSLEKYAGSPNNGTFGEFKFTVSATDQQKTRYVFTTDETRYNIAPTTATQHRAYAFYEMIVHVQTGNYEPTVQFVKVYNADETFYAGDSGEESKAFYGAVVTAIDGNGKAGYSSINAISKAIGDAVGKTNAPETAKQILYVDMTELAGVYEGSATSSETPMSMSDFLNKKSKNCLVFLPTGASAAFNNVVYKMDGGTFRAATNIVLTDKWPFFTPYSITVGAANYATYSRQISKDINGKVSKATLILPYALDITNGVHTNTTANPSDVACSFSLNTMDANNEFTKAPSSIDHPTAKFTAIGGDWSEANKPYTVKVLSADAVGNSLSFVATQYGATIAKTPTRGTNSTLGQLFYTNETATGTYNYKSKQDNQMKQESVTCTAEGNFRGVKYARSESENVFYFAANQFLNLHNLQASKDYLNVFPFRSVYTYTGGSSNTLRFFDVIFDDEIENTDAIAEMPQQADLVVRSGKGSLFMSSAIDQTVSVRSLNGMTVGELDMRAGDSRSINLPAGIYVVNNVKIIVK